MPLESITYIPDLVAANPTTSDGLVQGDDHLRGIKAALRNTLPNWTAAALTATQAELDAAVSQSKGLSVHVVPAGTAGAPGLQVVGDSDTGLYSPATNEVAVAVAGQKAVHVHADKSVDLTGAATVAGTLAVTGAITGPGSVPYGAVLEWYDDTLPTEGGWAWANGQIIASANTVCPVLLARWGSRFGGNGVSTMGVPDRREVAAYGKGTMGGTTSPGRITNYALTTIGSFIGACLYTLGLTEIPAHTHGPGNLSGTTGSVVTSINNASTGSNTPDISRTLSANTSSVSATMTSGVTGSSGGGGAHDNVSPGVVCNFIVRLG